MKKIVNIKKVFILTILLFSHLQSSLIFGIKNQYLNSLKKKNIPKSFFDKIINFSKIEDYINTPVKRYSTGMLIKLAFSISAFLDGDRGGDLILKELLLY